MEDLPRAPQLNGSKMEPKKWAFKKEWEARAYSATKREAWHFFNRGIACYSSRQNKKILELEEKISDLNLEINRLEEYEYMYKELCD